MARISIQTRLKVQRTEIAPATPPSGSFLLLQRLIISRLKRREEIVLVNRKGE
jgi:hypothetical protein